DEDADDVHVAALAAADHEDLVALGGVVRHRERDARAPVVALARDADDRERVAVAHDRRGAEHDLGREGAELEGGADAGGFGHGLVDPLGGGRVSRPGGLHASAAARAVSVSMTPPRRASSHRAPSAASAWMRAPSR